jgi:hypothetical protein
MPRIKCVISRNDLYTGSLQEFALDASCRRIPIIKLPQKCARSLTDIFSADGAVRLLSSGATQLSLTAYPIGS